MTFIKKVIKNTLPIYVYFYFSDGYYILHTTCNVKTLIAVDKKDNGLQFYFAIQYLPAIRGGYVPSPPANPEDPRIIYAV